MIREQRPVKSSGSSSEDSEIDKTNCTSDDSTSSTDSTEASKGDIDNDRSIMVAEPTILASSNIVDVLIMMW